MAFTQPVPSPFRRLIQRLGGRWFEKVSLGTSIRIWLRSMKVIAHASDKPASYEKFGARQPAGDAVRAVDRSAEFFC